MVKDAKGTKKQQAEAINGLWKGISLLQPRSLQSTVSYRRLKTSLVHSLADRKLTVAMTLHIFK